MLEKIISKYFEKKPFSYYIRTGKRHNIYPC